MGSYSRALALEQTGDYRTAAQSLMGVLQDVRASSEWEGACEWIAGCLERGGDDFQAGRWFETAGQLTLAGELPSVARRFSQALFFLQRASECYSRCGREGEAARARTTAITAVLEKACPPA